jgi:hypothetical protein
MDKTKLGVVGVIGSLAAMPLAANAASAQPAVPPAQSYADLFQPISNPVERLQLADEQEAGQARLIPAQYAVHHHHHHHHHARRWYMSHGYVWSNGTWVLRPRHHHHHHHHN